MLFELLVKMFDEVENDNLESLNNWFYGYLDSWYNDVKKNDWVKRFECFSCKKNEKLDELENRFQSLLDHLKRYEIGMSNAEKISKFADALPVEWNDFLMNLKKDSRFSNFYPKEFIRELKTHKFENDKKKKNLINEIEKNLDEISVDVILEMKRRVNMCLVAKNVMKYDMKRGCYINENMNPLDFVNFFCAATYKIETEVISKNEESKKNETSSSEPVCSKCDKSREDNVKLLKEVESLTLENENLKENEKELQNKIKI
ncbi:hypothetical protein Hanom_Chr05g00441231 [Helianthus anomalus]